MRLDRIDSYLTTFTATVTATTRATTTDDGTWIVLDRSAFYPTAGGQLHDTGTLDGQPVIDVKSEAGVVWHLVSTGSAAGEARDDTRSLLSSASLGASLSVGASVVGRVDWARRFTHMQRHTGQHLLSQAFLRVGAATGTGSAASSRRDEQPAFATKSVSLRGADCTLDLAGDPTTGLDVDACALAEAEANTAARRAMPVTTFAVDEQHLHEFKLRRPAKVGGLVRLVAIGDYDLVACGGTHVQNSAELLPILILGSERIRGGLTRVTFRVGAEAVADAVAKQSVIARLGVTLSSTAENLPAQVARLQAELAATRGALDAARSATAGYVTASALQAGTTVGAVTLVRVALGAHESALLDALVDRFQEAEGVVALCAAADGEKVRLAFTAGPGADVDVRPALHAALAVVRGRGGGRPDRAMGAGNDPTRLTEALDAAASVVASATAAS